MRGGYKIVDLRNSNISDVPITIPGIYESIEENHYKPLLLVGINIDGIERAGAFSGAVNDGTDYIFTNVYGGIVRITDTDVVTYNKN